MHDAANVDEIGAKRLLAWEEAQPRFQDCLK
jgi:hypothetical protein